MCTTHSFSFSHSNTPCRCDSPENKQVNNPACLSYFFPSMLNIHNISCISCIFPNALVLCPLHTPALTLLCLSFLPSCLPPSNSFSFSCPLLVRVWATLVTVFLGYPALELHALRKGY
ncbi:MAG: hypothetical protein BYD32DRAFT_43747 [Podila humilis]|nr:MAG: hypothetical protein BYD32DRAFT_43747 [Podila humilis]